MDQLEFYVVKDFLFHKSKSFHECVQIVNFNFELQSQILYLKLFSLFVKIYTFSFTYLAVGGVP
jgi:hypothetical protein